MSSNLPRASRIVVSAHALLRYVERVLGVDLTAERALYDRVRRGAYDDVSFVRWLGGRGIDAPAVRRDILERLVAPGGGRRTLLEARGLLWKPIRRSRAQRPRHDPAFAARRPAPMRVRRSRLRKKEIARDARVPQEFKHRRQDWLEAV